jgi:hypothetical protein
VRGWRRPWSTKRGNARGGNLCHEICDPNDGNAIFFSPNNNKIQRAREIQAEKEEAAQRAKAAKEEEKAGRKQEKEEKRCLVEEGKRNRPANKSSWKRVKILIV